MFRKMRLRFQPGGKGVDQVLGELESQVMNLVWDNPGATAREVHSWLSKRNLAYTTIVTILDRLHAKRLVAREKVGRRFAYTAAVNREDFEAQLTRDVLVGLLKDDSRPVLNTFVDLVSAKPELLDELEKLIRKRKA
jgi:predicted transcriptional regulator